MQYSYELIMVQKEISKGLNDGMSDTLYLKIDKNIQANSERIILKDIASIRCSSKPIETKVKLLKLPTEQIHGPGRYVFSILDVIDVIQKEYSGLEINNLGECDFIITVEKNNKPGDYMSWIKTGFVCVLAFFGAAFSIMAFNNDAGISQLFRQLYESITGNRSDGFTLLEISYSLGIGLGILIFFHHFSKKKHKSDPTPLEVEMRTYENDVDTTVIEAGNRQGS